jgi:uncharacterized repeat protein (TIGR01451 family)
MRKKSQNYLPKLLVCSACLLFASLLSQAALADAGVTATVPNPAPIEVRLQQFKVGKDEKGVPVLLEAKLVVPGDVLEYRATYSNHSKGPLSVVATLPVPEGLEYIKDSALATSRGNDRIAHTVAQKDSQFASEPLQRKTLGPDGASLTRGVPYADYRFVRWNLDNLAAGASADVSIRGKVSENLDRPTDTVK